MKARILIAAAALAALAGSVGAQPAGTSPSPGASVASSPRMGMGGGRMGGGMQNGMRGPRVGPDSTPGWSMMTREEREQHRNEMRSAKTPEECQALMDKQHQQMVARAKERGIAMPGKPRRDGCAGMMR